ncbi:MAG TPA: hypothetical protein G4O13_03170 [Dehalococcoidia bacterium]|nr:hypothetical protein [Dehalococcoidia bacterium]
MSKVKQLHELQEIDLDIEHKNETLTQIKSRLGKDDDLISARLALDTARKRLAELEHQQRTAEWGVDDIGKKIAHEEKKLYDGSVKNPRELMSLQQEVEHLKEQHKQQEEQLLNLMLEVDAAQQDAARQSSELEEMDKAWHENQNQLSKEQAEIETELAALEQKREALVEQVDTAGLRTYEEIRKARQGLAVAKVVQGRCQGCRISLPMSDQQRARIGHELARCSNCGRILYMD